MISRNWSSWFDGLVARMTNEFEKLETALLRAGREMEFPDTPAIAARVSAVITRGLASGQAGGVEPRGWTRLAAPVAVAILLGLVLLLALPNARAAIGQFLGLRGLQIFYVTPTPANGMPLTTVPGNTPTQHSPAQPSNPTPRPEGEGDVNARRGNATPTGDKSSEGGRAATPRASKTPTAQPFTLCCKVSLEEAQRRARFKLLMPPNELPTEVYYQDVFGNGEQVVMVFGDVEHPQFTLYQAQRWIYGKMIGKTAGEATLLKETNVGGERALWFSGAPHVVMMLDASGQPVYDSARTVDANTLVWETGNEYDGIIYRLETKLALPEAVGIAETLVHAE